MVRKRCLIIAAVCVVVLAFFVGFHCIPRQVTLELPATICTESIDDSVTSSLLIKGTWLPRFCSKRPHQFKGVIRVSGLSFTSDESVWSNDLKFERDPENHDLLHAGLFYNTENETKGGGWIFLNKDSSQVVLILKEKDRPDGSEVTVIAPADSISEAKRIIDEFPLNLKALSE